MKMVKSLLLGTAAGFVAVAGAQAADMPVKAAVQYVKICNLYGDGFYYIPGTNICLKLGGYVRAQFYGYYGGSKRDRDAVLRGEHQQRPRHRVGFNGVSTAPARLAPTSPCAPAR